jgi:type IV pilus assembly protein PilB
MSNFGAEHIDLSQVQFTPELLRLLPVEMVRKYRVLPVYKAGVNIAIAMADPSDLNAVDQLTHFLNSIIELRVADKDQLDTFILRLYGSSAR